MKRPQSAKLEGYFHGMAVYSHPDIPRDKIYAINPAHWRYEPLPPFNFKFPLSERPPWSWSLPGEKR